MKPWAATRASVPSSVGAPAGVKQPKRQCAQKEAKASNRPHVKPPERATRPGRENASAVARHLKAGSKHPCAPDLAGTPT